MGDNLLTFEVSSEGDALFIHGDPASFRFLSETFRELADGAENGDFPHCHLFSPDWGGDELSKNSQEGLNCVDHVKIYGWPDNRGAAPYMTKEQT